ncbi:uncharacterized protein G2W53_018292 [Senna tora]|uniref:Uncharacterized protein n=1 Tax=Senna tora TaxID=362788 RepID=A0A834TRE9_9FABA|nr:uncharacterized protein G2W53_018292 [Senna tora]
MRRYLTFPHPWRPSSKRQRLGVVVASGSAVAMGGGAKMGDIRWMEQENREKKRRTMCAG